MRFADQRRQFILFAGIIVVIQWLYKRFIKFLRQFLAQNLRSKRFPQKSESRIRNSIFADPAVFLVMIILPSSDIKNKTFIIFRNRISTCDGDFRIQI